jgi:non-specific serine/threonine protein kinase
MPVAQESSFGVLLRRYREAAGRTQEELAACAGMSPRGLRHLERGERRPYPDTVSRLAAALALTTEDRAAFAAAARVIVHEGAKTLHNLPAQLTSFVGREHALGQVRWLLAERPDRQRLVTLTGAGGCGKTRLALEVAGGLLDHYAQDVWLVELAPLADPTIVPLAIATALGLREEAGQPLSETLTTALRTRRLLLVLDNCEHLIEACAHLAATLLRACPELQILATSREPLGLAGETVWRVPSLLAPEPERLPPLEALTQYEAVRLFIDRAQAVQPRFALTERNAPAVAQVCRRLDGIPLAIELAAALVRGLPVAQIAQRLDQRFGLLAGHNWAALPRQQTLRATVDWSYQLLSAHEQTLFNRLAIFAGGFTFEAVEAVCAGGPILTGDVPGLLVRLVDTSLVVGQDGGGEIERYRLLETLRQYGRERLEAAGDEAWARDRHLTYFLALAVQAEPALTGSAQGPWLTCLEAEHDNLRAALQWARATEAMERGLRLAGALWRFWLIRGHLTEGREWLEDLLSRLKGNEAPPVLAQALSGASGLAIRQGDYAQAALLAERSLALFRELEDTAGVADALNQLGQVATDQGDHRRATALHEQSLALRRRLGDTRSIAVSLLNLGDLATAGGDFARAAVLLDESLALCRQAGAQENLGVVLLNLGDLALAQHQYEDAGKRYQQALEKFQQLEHRWGAATALFDLGEALRHQGQYARAADLYQESLDLARAIGDRGCIGWSLAGLSAAVHALGDGERALALAEESLSLFRSLSNPKGVARALGALANAAGAQGR